LKGILEKIAINDALPVEANYNHDIAKCSHSSGSESEEMAQMKSANFCCLYSDT